jgi:acylphosphatase
VSAIRQVARHVVFRGQVQGVGFRAFVEHAAFHQGIEGWVRNRRDGTVEAVFSGAAETVEAVIAACRKGPRHGRVDEVEAREASADELALSGGESFAVLPTIQVRSG